MKYKDVLATLQYLVGFQSVHISMIIYGSLLYVYILPTISDAIEECDIAREEYQHLKSQWVYADMFLMFCTHTFVIIVHQFRNSLSW